MCAWTWGDPTLPNPIDWILLPGDALLDLSGLSEDDVLVLIALARRLQETERDTLLATVPRIAAPTLPPPDADHVYSWQPGYRRICQRPTQGWHEKEMKARFMANRRFAAGKDEETVIEEEFTHLSKAEKAVRKGMKPRGIMFPLIPMVKIIERKLIKADGSEEVEIMRQFPFHLPVAEF